ncbi:hypothetical protein IE53DRAFT_365660 [Violaceomyces palustris]|uniref:Uncharacterized protein n=1 Tax=Violaceomyces palustris TaxID=1673888 RepID=A0ACD0P7Z9_9BASI|nr:hypothetical protein IE53DRAFT_365660 [Violaceomyces palustris]
MVYHNTASSTGAEEAETPILCETCLGPNPYVRMSKQNLGKECKICTRPFTVFRWNPGVDMRFKKTEICTTCAKVKNVCQTCVLDLQYGLPVQVRDTALNIKTQSQTSEASKRYFANQMEDKLEGPSSLIDSSSGPSSRAGQDLLRKLARTDPGYKRNRPHLCSFYAKGNCTRGDECPYRHELPVDNELSKQNIQDRFYGRNDPVAKKILSAHAAEQGLTPPEDKSITSLFLSSLPPEINEDQIRTFFIKSVPQLEPHHIKSITMVAASKCAFINFKTREQAEWAALRCSVKVEIAGKECRVSWGRSRPARKGGITASKPSSAERAKIEEESAGSYGIPS